MGKLKKRYNAKARQESCVDVNVEQRKNEELAKLVYFDSENVVYKSSHDTSNALVMESKKKVPKTKTKDLKSKQTKILTKKQKKKLECYIARKQKEKKRGDIIKSLSENQLTQEELSMYKPTTTIGQVLHCKRKENNEFNQYNVPQNINKNRKRRKLNLKHDVDTSFDVISLPSMNTDDQDWSDTSDEQSDDDNEDSVKEGKLLSPIIITQEEKIIDEQSDDKEDSIKEEQLLPPVTEGYKYITSEATIVAACKEKQEKDEFENNDMLAGPKISSSESEFGNVPNQGDLIVITEDKIISKPIPQAEPVKPIYVGLNRNTNIQAARLLLPILPEEQVVMETIQENDVVIICGSTGSGKTTQVPQFLYEAGYGSHSSRPGMIGVTEPRRVAAMSMSKRVAEEMNMPSRKISYQIRYEGNTSDETMIKFMTDGVLLKEMESDFLLSKYSVIIIDEAHERSVYTDILIGLLTRVVPLRKKRGNTLKLIIMSATLRVEDFTDNKCLFANPPPVLKIDSRQYPVTIHFNRKTAEDYVTEAFRKICKIHHSFKLDGGILVFMTGQREVLSLCNKLRKSFPKKGKSMLISEVENEDTSPQEGINSINVLPKIDLDKYTTLSNLSTKIEDDNDILECDSSGDEMCITDDNTNEYLPLNTDYAPLQVLPLYSLLSTDEQSKVFSEVPEGNRVCIIATNVAETSLTIPGIKYIIDCGKAKKKYFDKVTGVSTFRITWTSKASANQRAGRAGRVGPGHCYRLYSSAVFDNNFEEFSEPEIRRRPVDDLVLQMKNMCIDKVLNFPFPSPPEQSALKSAEELLLELGALKNKKTKQSNQLTTITSLGRSLSKIPVSPRFAKMIHLASKHEGCMQYIITIAAALAVKDIFTNNIDLSEEADIDEEDARKKKLMITRARRKWAGDGPSSELGDMMVILRAVGASEYTGCSQSFCADNGLRYKAMMEIRKLRTQLSKAACSIFNGETISMDLKMNPPSNEQAVKIRQIMLSCMTDHVARKIPNELAKSLKLKNAYECCSVEDPVYIHPISSLFSKLPEYVVYHEINETSKLYMKTLFIVSEDWLPLYAPYKCHLGKPLENPPPCYDQNTGEVRCYMSSTYGPRVWPLPPQLLPYPECPEKYRQFAKAFLDGEVCEQLKQFSSHLVTPSSVMVKSWAHLKPKTVGLLCCFMEKSIKDKSTLLHVWMKNPNYILSHYLKWLPDSQHGSVKAIWPPS